MVESFNGWIFLIIYLLNWAGGAMYAYQTVFNTVPWLSKYGIHESGVLPTRVLGTFVQIFKFLIPHVFNIQPKHYQQIALIILLIIQQSPDGVIARFTVKP